MVIGEELLLSKALDALVRWFQKRKNDKKTAHNILMNLKSNLTSITIHMKLSMEYDHINYSKLRNYLPNDIDNLNTFLIKYQNELDNILYSELMNFIDYLIEYNKTISIIFGGMGNTLRKYEININSYIEEYVQSIDELLEEV